MISSVNFVQFIQKHYAQCCFSPTETREKMSEYLSLRDFFIRDEMKNLPT